MIKSEIIKQGGARYIWFRCRESWIPRFCDAFAGSRASQCVCARVMPRKGKVDALSGAATLELNNKNHQMLQDRMHSPRIPAT
eukprot:5670956-Amphidinium_carterae.1